MQRDHHLTVGDLAHASQVLAGDADAQAALLDHARLVQDDVRLLVHMPGFLKPLLDPGSIQRHRIPRRSRQKVLDVLSS